MNTYTIYWTYHTYKNTTIKTIILCWNVLHEKEHLMFILYIHIIVLHLRFHKLFSKK